MSQFEYYGTYEDSSAILQDLIDTKRYTFFVDRPYSEPSPDMFIDLDDQMVEKISIRSSLFIS